MKDLLIWRRLLSTIIPFAATRLFTGKLRKDFAKAFETYPVIGKQACMVKIKNYDHKIIRSSQADKINSLK
ncbi:MAG: hypothetical protein IT308_06215 [Anaerolineaceae bacterium]|nr:hypothetical protein [Anaerolineaceae bacterium]